MGDRWLAVLHCVIYCIAFCTIACSAQKQAAKQDDWAMNNATIGPDSPIEVRAGTYDLDLKGSKIKLMPTWPQKPPSNWSYLLKDGDKTLILHPLEPQDDLESGCGYILAR
jgi:hypothetical protein